MLAYGEREKKANGRDLNDRTEGLMVIDARLLVKPLSYKPSFVARRLPMERRFDLINPFATNDRTIGRSRD